MEDTIMQFNELKEKAAFGSHLELKKKIKYSWV